MELLSKLKIGQFISITLHVNKQLDGAFYCYDPESQSVIIQNAEDDLIWVNGHNIDSINPNPLEQSATDILQSALLRTIELKSVELLKEDENEECKLSDETIKIQQQLMRFLEEHQLSPELDETSNDIKIGSSLRIKPPYTTNCCRSSNEIILSTLLTLLNEFYARHNDDLTESEEVLEID